ncbi:hypothetical protein RUM43_014368 [Polyplax serrata]|uniref:Uncharacterized protein n=1 Tax=Polyplax serrata TaxID=468196 RepID=A0AAN8NZ62_POLSC
MFKVMRRRSARVALVSVVFLTVLACLYYASYTNSVGPTQGSESRGNAGPGEGGLNLKFARVKQQGFRDVLLRPLATGDREWIDQDSSINSDVCPVIRSIKTDVDTVETFKTFDFQPSWMKSKEYWDGYFEDRYKERKRTWSNLPLKSLNSQTRGKANKSRSEGQRRTVGGLQPKLQQKRQQRLKFYKRPVDAPGQ